MIAQARREERERIARDLHDQVGQDMACLTMGLHLLQPHLASPEGAAKLAHVRQLTDHLAQELHRLVVDARLPGIDDGEFVSMLGTMARVWSDGSGITVQLTLEGMETSLSPLIETALFRVCQECLTNVAKHAATATCVRIALHRTKKEIMLSIADDGFGFPAAISEKGEFLSNHKRYGIVGMRERLAMIGGIITISSEQSVGTQVVARVPL